MRYQLAQPVPQFDDHISITTIPCPECNETTTFVVNKADFEAARDGTLIQKAFPSMHAADRERLITGYCSDCWDRLFDDGTYDDLDKD